MEASGALPQGVVAYVDQELATLDTNSIPLNGHEGNPNGNSTSTLLLPTRDTTRVHHAIGDTLDAFARPLVSMNPYTADHLGLGVREMDMVRTLETVLGILTAR